MVVMTGSNRLAVAAARTLEELAERAKTQQEHTETPKNSVVAESSDDLSPMTDAEYETLADLEANISDSWWKMGQAFAEIKAKKLYRQTKDGTRRTWDEYCKDAHRISKQQVDKIIRAADVRLTLETETKVSVLPATVSQAAELSGLQPAEMATATEDAVTAAVSENRKPTAKDFKRAAATLKIANTGELSAPTSQSYEGGKAAEEPPAQERRQQRPFRFRASVRSKDDLVLKAVDRITAEHEIKITKRGKPSGGVVCHPTPDNIKNWLTNLGVWLEANKPGDFRLIIESQE